MLLPWWARKNRLVGILVGKTFQDCAPKLPLPSSDRLRWCERTRPKSSITELQLAFQELTRLSGRCSQPQQLPRARRPPQSTSTPVVARALKPVEPDEVQLWIPLRPPRSRSEHH